MEFSRLEATINEAKSPRRPMSIKNDHIGITATNQDLNANDLDFDFEATSLSHLQQTETRCSMQDRFAIVQYEKHTHNTLNFSDSSQVDYLYIDGCHSKWSKLREGIAPMSPLTIPTNRRQTLLILLAPIIPAPDTSYGGKTAFSSKDADQIFSQFRIHPSYLLNVLGRPDYWAPSTHIHIANDGTPITYGKHLKAYKFSMVLLIPSKN